jgi:hypothetical protein
MAKNREILPKERDFLGFWPFRAAFSRFSAVSDCVSLGPEIAPLDLTSAGYAEELQSRS